MHDSVTMEACGGWLSIGAQPMRRIASDLGSEAKDRIMNLPPMKPLLRKSIISGSLGEENDVA